MTFQPYTDDVSIEGVEDGYILLGIHGSQSYRSGEYTNEKNATITIQVSPETMTDLISDAQAALEKVHDEFVTVTLQSEESVQRKCGPLGEVRVPPEFAFTTCDLCGKGGYALTTALDAAYEKDATVRCEECE